MSDLKKLRKKFNEYHKKHEIDGEGGYGGYFSSHTNKGLEDSIYGFYEAGYLKALKEQISQPILKLKGLHHNVEYVECPLCGQQTNIEEAIDDGCVYPECEKCGDNFHLRIVSFIQPYTEYVGSRSENDHWVLRVSL